VLDQKFVQNILFFVQKTKRPADVSVEHLQVFLLLSGGIKII